MCVWDAGRSSLVAHTHVTVKIERHAIRPKLCNVYGMEKGHNVVAMQTKCLIFICFIVRIPTFPCDTWKMYGNSLLYHTRCSSTIYSSVPMFTQCTMSSYFTVPFAGYSSPWIPTYQFTHRQHHLLSEEDIRLCHIVHEHGHAMQCIDCTTTTIVISVSPLLTLLRLSIVALEWDRKYIFLFSTFFCTLSLCVRRTMKYEMIAKWRCVCVCFVWLWKENSNQRNCTEKNIKSSDNSAALSIFFCCCYNGTKRNLMLYKDSMDSLYLFLVCHALRSAITSHVPLHHSQSTRCTTTKWRSTYFSQGRKVFSLSIQYYIFFLSGMPLPYRRRRHLSLSFYPRVFVCASVDVVSFEKNYGFMNYSMFAVGVWGAMQCIELTLWELFHIVLPLTPTRWR